jgi:hypothetical protein
MKRLGNKMIVVSPLQDKVDFSRGKALPPRLFFY